MHSRSVVDSDREKANNKKLENNYKIKQRLHFH